MKSFIKKSLVMLVAIIIVMEIFIPFTTVNAAKKTSYSTAPGDWVRISSTSYTIIHEMSVQVKYGKFVSKTNYDYYQPYDRSIKNELKIIHDNNSGSYVIYIPKNYFDIYDERPLDEQDGMWDSDKYGYPDRVDTFDFSNNNLKDEDLSVLPNFYRWSHDFTSVLKFNNCGITDLSAFKDKNNLSRLRNTGIELGGNNIKREDYEEFKNLASQYSIHILVEPNIIEKTSSNGGSQTKTGGNGSNGGSQTKTGGLSNPEIDLSSIAGAAAGITAGANYSQNVGTSGSTTTSSNKGTTSTDSNTSTKANKAGKQNTTTIITTTTPYYTFGSSLESWVELTPDGVFAKEIKLIIHAEMSGYKNCIDGNFIPAENSDCVIKVNGTSVTNNNGRGEYTVTENGTYTIEVKPDYYGEGTSHTIKITNIDKTKPEYSLSTFSGKAIQDGGSYGTGVKIEVKDDKQLNSITFNGIKRNIPSYKLKSEYFYVSKTGDYKVIVEDAAGNSIEKTEHITVDTAKPKMQSVEILKNDKKMVGNRAKIGDILTFKVKANKVIKGLRTNRFG